MKPGHIGKHATLALLSHARSLNGPVTVKDAQGNVLDIIDRPPSYTAIRNYSLQEGPKLPPKTREDRAADQLWKANRHLFRKPEPKA